MKSATIIALCIALFATASAQECQITVPLGQFHNITVDVDDVAPYNKVCDAFSPRPEIPPKNQLACA